MHHQETTDRIAHRADEVGERASHAATKFATRVAAGLDDARGRVADAFSPGEEAAHRQLHLVREGLSGMERDLDGRIGEVRSSVLDHMDELHAENRGNWEQLIKAQRRTTWPRRFFWLAAGAAAAAVATWLSDPQHGRERRARLRDQALARGREVGEQVQQQATTTLNETRGKVVETAKSAMPEDVPSDPVVLEQRIKSEVFGHHEDTSDVVITIGQPGEVTLKGTIGDADAERRLVDDVAAVNGVTDVRSELRVSQAQ